MKKIIKISETIGMLENVELIYLFGSRVENPDKENSDIDLCIVIENDSNEDIVYEKIVDLIQDEKLLIHPIIYQKNDFEKKIKIHSYKESIIEKGKLIYKK